MDHGELCGQANFHKTRDISPDILPSSGQPVFERQDVPQYSTKTNKIIHHFQQMKRIIIINIQHIFLWRE